VFQYLSTVGLSASECGTSFSVDDIRADMQPRAADAPTQDRFQQVWW